MKRKPAVAGRFYTADPDGLRQEVTAFTAYNGDREKRTGCVVPHAGYMFSGGTAGKVLARCVIPAEVIILSPNHTGAGADFSVWDGDAWESPLGDTAIDKELRKAVLGAEHTELDAAAHIAEHSIEVIVPFLKVLNPQARIVPVTIRCRILEKLLAFGRSLAGIIGERNVLVIASSDMTHMETAEEARAKDQKCIKAMESVDPEGLFEVVRRHAISMCGVYPVTALLACCRQRGVNRGELVEYTNSGEASGDFNRVVGYAGMVF